MKGFIVVFLLFLGAMGAVGYKFNTSGIYIKNGSIKAFAVRTQQHAKVQFKYITVDAKLPHKANIRSVGISRSKVSNQRHKTWISLYPSDVIPIPKSEAGEDIYIGLTNVADKPYSDMTCSISWPSAPGVQGSIKWIGSNLVKGSLTLKMTKDTIFWKVWDPIKMSVSGTFIRIFWKLSHGYYYGDIFAILSDNPNISENSEKGSDQMCKL